MDLKKTMNTDYIGSWDFIKNEKKGINGQRSSTKNGIQS